MPAFRTKSIGGVVFVALLLTFTSALAAPIFQESTPESCPNIEQADVLVEQGMQLIDSGQFSDAREKLEGAREIYSLCGHLETEADVLTMIGISYYWEGLLDEAIAFEIEALTLAEQAPSLQIQIDALVNLAFFYSAQDNHENALESAEQCIEKAEASEDPENRTSCLFVKGYVLNELGVEKQRQARYDEAQMLLNEAYAIFLDIDMVPEQASVLHNLGANYGLQGQHSQALIEYQKALEIVQQTNDMQIQGRVLHSMGGSYQDMGDFAQALILYFQALDIQRQIGDLDGEGRTQLSIGEAYTAIGECEKATNYLQNAVENFQTINDQIQVGKALNSLAVNFGCLGQYQEELDYYLEARDVFANSDGDIALEVPVLANIGEFFRLEGRYDEALSYLEQALDIVQGGGLKITEAAILHNMGALYYNLDDYEKSLEYAQEALALQRLIGNRPEEAKTLFDIGFVYEKQGDVVQALLYYEQAVEVIESVRSEIKIEELKTPFTEGRLEVFERLAALLWEQSRYEESFNYMERARARSFLDQLAAGTVDFHTGLAPELVSREEELQSEIAAKRAQLIQMRNLPVEEQDSVYINNVELDIAMLEEEYEKLIIELKLRSPRLASFISGDVATLSEIQEELRADSTLIEYFVTNPKILVFVVTKESLEIVTLSISEEAINTQIKAFHDFPDTDSAYPVSATTLYNSLITPLRPYLNTDHLIFVPHQALHYIPFAALTDGERYLLDDYTITYLPSASMLQFLPVSNERPIYDTALILGNPSVEMAYDLDTPLSNLPNAEQSAQKIANLFGTIPLLEDAATEGSVRQNVGNANILHLGAHGSYNTIAPMQSTIYLAPGNDGMDTANDGRLHVQEVYSLPLDNIELVVLSACETNLGYLDRENPLANISIGDEVVSMNRAFLFQSPTVISTLWAVDDTATSLLIEQFYTSLLEGKSKADALRLAQQYIRDYGDGEYANPYYWAGFVLSGDSGEIDPDLGSPTPTPVTNGEIEMNATLTSDNAEETALPEPTPTPNSGNGGGGICAGAALPLGLVVLAVGRRKKSLKRNKTAASIKEENS